MDKNVFEIMEEENKRRAALRQDLINGIGITSDLEEPTETGKDTAAFEKAVRALTNVKDLTGRQELVEAVHKWLTTRLDLLKDFEGYLKGLVDRNTAPNTLEAFMVLEDQINEFGRLQIREVFSRQGAALIEEWFSDEDNEQVFGYMNCVCDYVLTFMMEQADVFAPLSDQVHDNYMKWVESSYRNEIGRNETCPICARIEKVHETLMYAKETYQRLVRSRDVVHVMRGDEPECYAHSVSGLNALFAVTQEMHALIELMDLVMMLTPLDLSSDESHYDELAEGLAAIMEQAEKTGQLVDFMADRLGIDDEVNSGCLYPEMEDVFSICFGCNCDDCDGCGGCDED